MASDKLATAKQQRDWLRTLPAATGLTLSGIATAIGVSRSTLSAKLSESDDGTSLLRADTIDKIVARFRVARPGDPAGVSFGEDAVRYLPEKNDPLGPAVKALIAGRNGIEAWAIRTRALELVGYLPDDVVLVDTTASPVPGDAVYAQVHDWTRVNVENVMRVYERASPVAMLVTKTLEPGLQTPVVVDGERVVVKGVILPHRLRLPHTEAA